MSVASIPNAVPRPEVAHKATVPRASSLRRTAFVLAAVVFVVYLSNLRFISTGDTTATRYVPFSIVMRGRLDVDPWIGPYVKPYEEGKLPWGTYFARPERGHWVSSYPILTPVLVAPLYIPAAIWIERKPVPPSPEQMRFYAEAMEKISASLIAALSVAIFYLALSKIVSRKGALALALVYALASPTWNISSQALWLHGVTELSLALLLWALVNDLGDRRGAFWIGFALALAMANKPTNAVVALPVIIYFLWRHRRRWLPFFAPLVTLGALVAAYNLYWFGAVTGAYGSAFRAAGYSGLADGFRGNVALGAAGMLLSPNRGVLWFCPWVFFALWGAARAWRQQEWPWIRLAILGAALYFLTYAKVEHWYGGYCFGPRYLTDIMPFLVFFLVPLWPFLSARSAICAPFAIVVVLAIGIQLLGVYYYPSGDWDATPVSVDAQPSRVWDWRDPQILRTLRAGPAPIRLSQRLRGDYVSH